MPIARCCEQNRMAQENANPARENLKYLCFIVLSAVVSIAVCYSYLENNNQANQIGELQKNLGEIMKHIFSPHGVSDSKSTTQLTKLNFKDQVITEIQEARKTIDVLQNRINFLEKINYDKFGRTDYASSDLGGKVVSVTSKQRGSTLWDFVERRLKIGRFKVSNVHCCIIQNSCMGHCQAFYGSSAVIVIQLMAKLFIDGITIEHTPSNKVPDVSSQSAMKKFSIWGSNSTMKTTEDFFFGEFIFDVEEDFLQSYNFSTRSSSPYRFIKMVVLSNHGADYTCIYRIRVHGTLSQKHH
nr:SUN domain-containing protein 2-like [Aedes albopictus]